MCFYFPIGRGYDRHPSVDCTFGLPEGTNLWARLSQITNVCANDFAAVAACSDPEKQTLLTWSSYFPAENFALGK